MSNGTRYLKFDRQEQGSSYRSYLDLLMQQSVVQFNRQSTRARNWCYKTIGLQDKGIGVATSTYTRKEKRREDLLGVDMTFEGSFMRSSKCLKIVTSFPSFRPGFLFHTSWMEEKYYFYKYTIFFVMLSLNHVTSLVLSTNLRNHIIIYHISKNLFNYLLVMPPLVSSFKDLLFLPHEV